ncbi:Reverse transcriptase domain-containing protein, partial [Aphis craccivora]
IPLETKLELTLFKIILIPHLVDQCFPNIVLKPEYQYVGITKNHRQFTTFTETELLHCEKTEIFTICPEFQPIQHESKEQPCEISLFKNPDQLPQNCESGVECRAYAEHVVLNPNREIKTKYYINSILKIGTGNISYKINNSIKEIKMEKFKHRFDSRKLDNVHVMAHSLDEVDCREHVINEFKKRHINSQATSMVVISGAISNSLECLDRFKIRKLEGRPLLLPLNEEARPMCETELQVAVRKIKRVFRSLDQLKQILNLTKGYIDSYIRRGNKENVIVVWNGHSDKNILKRLDLNQFIIGTYDKSGRLLNLVETHDIICKKKHLTTYVHDPRMDVNNRNS